MSKEAEGKVAYVLPSRKKDKSIIKGKYTLKLETPEPLFVDVWERSGLVEKLETAKGHGSLVRVYYEEEPWKSNPSKFNNVAQQVEGVNGASLEPAEPDVSDISWGPEETKDPTVDDWSKPSSYVAEKKPGDFPTQELEGSWAIATLVHAGMKPNNPQLRADAVALVHLKRKVADDLRRGA